MKYDFPTEELKSEELILKFAGKNMYFPYGLFEDNNLIAYAMLFKLKNSEYMLMDYYAVLKEFRSKRYGSVFLKMLKEKLSYLKGIIFEVESGNTALNETELEICKKRISFYLNNGLIKKDLTCILNGVELRIFLLVGSENANADTLYNELDSIYKVMYGNEIYNKSVFLKKIK